MQQRRGTSEHKTPTLEASRPLIPRQHRSLHVSVHFPSIRSVLSPLTWRWSHHCYCTPMEAGSLFRVAAASQAAFLCNSYSHHCPWFPLFRTCSQKRALIRPIGKRCYGTDSTGDFFSTSKRRSRGPVMAAKKAAQGNAFCSFECAS